MKKFSNKNEFRSIRGIVFDLDDTLYLERDYVAGGFASIAEESAKLSGVSEKHIFDYLWTLFETGVRKNTFDRLLQEFPVLAEYVQTADLIQVYRAHKPTIKPLAGVLELVKDLRVRGIETGLLSDGPLESQQTKVTALGLNDFFGPIILTDVWGRSFWKPHPKGFKYISKTWKLAPETLVYIGDNPEKDFVAPNKLGWHTVRLRLSGQERFALEPASRNHAPDFEINGFAELLRKTAVK